MGRPKKRQKQKKPPTEKSPDSLHFIPEWAERRGLEQVDFIEALGVDKGTVSRWFAGQLPAEINIPRIAAFLEIGVDDLFRAPHDDWLLRFFQNRSEDELKRMRASLELHFPRQKKDGTDG